jgi:hypothetical protein
VALFQDLSCTAQTNFAELVEQAFGSLADRSAVDLPGSFNRKSVNGTTYWYWQYRDLQGSSTQIYLGPHNDRLEALLRAREARKDSEIGALARACGVLGCTQVARHHFKVLQRLSDHGFFRVGGVLTGTHALVGMSNMLGVRWTEDFAHPEAKLSLVLPRSSEVEVPDAITSLQRGILPRRTAQGWAAMCPSDVELLTPTGQEDENTVQTVLISGQNTLVVNIPAPMRYAMDKLRLMRGKTDAGQVATLVQFGLERAPTRLRDAAHSIDGWAGGLRVLAAHYPDVSRKLEPLLADERSS